MKGFLILESGESFAGEWFGRAAQVGEVVFNTSHSGYEEIVTDPSYFGQIMVMTAPMQGNYGTHDEDWESSRVWVRGFVCVELETQGPGRKWFERMESLGVPFLSSVDTRRLVLRLRSGGTPVGVLLAADSEGEAREKAKAHFAGFHVLRGQDWTQKVSRDSIQDLRGSRADGPRLAVVDFGAKENILREVCHLAKEVRVFPSGTSAAQILEWNPAGIVLSNGPGDPTDVKAGIETTKQLIGQRPLFGICMGHQVLALALGARTFKLRFGHRGGNHPVRDHLLNRVYITSQNHGYAVDTQSLAEGVQQTHVNLYDGTCEGIELAARKCMSVQFHPESCPGPHDARPLFQLFKERWL